MENPTATDPKAKLPQLKFEGKSPADLAKFVFDISVAEYKGDDIRVCSLGLVRSADNKSWELAFINAHK